MKDHITSYYQPRKELVSTESGYEGSYNELLSTEDNPNKDTKHQFGEFPILNVFPILINHFKTLHDSQGKDSSFYF